MSFTKLKSNGSRVRVDLAKVKFFTEAGNNTLLTFDDGEELLVDESFQTVSNRAGKEPEVAEPVQA